MGPPRPEPVLIPPEGPEAGPTRTKDRTAADAASSLSRRRRYPTGRRVLTASSGRARRRSRFPCYCSFPTCYFPVPVELFP